MNKTYCVDCHKEIEYKGFCCPTRCYECANKSLTSHSIVDWEYVSAKISVGVPCVICGETVILTPNEEMASRYKTIVKVCDKCKQAIMKIREQIEDYERTGGLCLD